MTSYALGNRIAGDVGVGNPLRRVAVARCRRCHRPRAYLLVDRDHLTSMADLVDHAVWSESGPDLGCRCEQLPALPAASSLTPKIHAAYRRSEDKLLGRPPRLPRAKRFCSPADLQAHEEALAMYERENAPMRRRLGDPGVLHGWLDPDVNEEGRRAAVSIDL